MNKHRFNIYPEIKDEDFERLKESLKKGYDKTFPIITYQDSVLDGWNRYRACTELRIKPVYTHFYGTDEEALNFVIKSNERRDLSKSQRACLALEYEQIFAIEAKKRQGNRNDIHTNIPKKMLEGSESRKQAGDMFNVNDHYVSDAKKLKKEHPDIFQEVLNGDKNLSGAKKELYIKKNKHKYIYIYKLDDFHGQSYFKIGISKSPESRAADFKCSSPFDGEIIFKKHIKDAEEVEIDIHNKLSKYRIRNEWFDFDKNVLGNIISYISKKFEKYEFKF